MPSWLPAAALAVLVLLAAVGHPAAEPCTAVAYSDAAALSRGAAASAVSRALAAPRGGARRGHSGRCAALGRHLGNSGQRLGAADHHPRPGQPLTPVPTPWGNHWPY